MPDADTFSESETPTEAPWPIVGECFSDHVKGHACPQCDGSHDHRWVAWHEAPEVAPGIHTDGEGWSAPGLPVRCRECGARKCDMARCLFMRHHNGPHEEF